jgi:hypothetical protein
VRHYRVMRTMQIYIDWMTNTSWCQAVLL